MDVLCILVALLFSTSLAGTVRTLPPGSTSSQVQAALDMSSSSDVVELGPGGSFILNVSISVSGVTLRGVDLPVVVPNRDFAAVSVAIGITGAVLQGLRFTGASVAQNNGALVLEQGSSALVEDCEFVNNFGMFTVVVSANVIATFNRCIFARNALNGIRLCGAAIDAFNSNVTVTIRQSEIVNNTINRNDTVAGAVCIGQFNSNGNAIISDCIFRNNTAFCTNPAAANEAGALTVRFDDLVSSSTTKILRTIFEQNLNSGGLERGSAALLTAFDAIDLDTVLFINNGSPMSQSGGALVVTGQTNEGSAKAKLRNVTFRNNTSSDWTGGLAVGRFNPCPAEVTCNGCYFKGNSPSHICVSYTDGGNCTLLGADIAFGDSAPGKEIRVLRRDIVLAVNVSLSQGSAKSVFQFPGAGVLVPTCIFNGSSTDCNNTFPESSATGNVPLLITPADQLQVGLSSVKKSTDPPLIILMNTTIVGSLTILQNASLVVAVGSSLSVTGDVVIGNGAIITLSNVSLAGSFTVIRAGNSVSLSRQVVVRTIVASPSCQSAIGVSSQTQGLSVIVSVSSFVDSCVQPTSDGLSTGATIGICVGAVFGGVALVIGIVLVSRALLAHRTSSMRSNLKMHDMRNLKAAQTTF